MNTFKLYSLGCKVNQYDSNYLSGKLIAAGLKLAEKNADIAIINTCAVTKNAVKKDKFIINKAKKENPSAKIIIIGCWPKIYGAEINKIQADKIIIKKDLDDLADEIFIFLKIKAHQDARRPIGCWVSNRALSRSRYTIKIQDGCEQFCSYCIIPYARGKPQSRPADEVLREIKTAAAAGYGEIILCGIHLGLYGRENQNDKSKFKINLVNLLKEIIKIKKIGRIRLSSIEITEINDNLINLMAMSNKICKHLHLPLQSGSDQILKAMNRPYDTAYFRHKVQVLRKAMPDIAITTDIIVGFSGETEADFKKTYEFIKAMKFSRLHIFPFSAHEKTPAFFMEGKVSREKTESRANKLRELGGKLENEYKKKFIGRKLEVVVENKRGDKYIGKSEFYFNARVNKSDIKSFNGKIIGQLIKIKYS